MALALRSGPVDLSDPAALEAVTRAWYLQRYGAQEMGRRLPWCPRFDVAALIDAAALYRRHAAARLPGMPADPVGALLRLGSTPLPPYEVRRQRPDGRWETTMRYPELPDTIAYAVRGLRLLARDMAAATALLQDTRPTIQHPELYQRPTTGRIAFRTGPADVWDEDTTARRQRVRDQLTAAGGNPRRHQSLEGMELELIDRERHGLLALQFSHPSPTAMRAHRGAWMPPWHSPKPAPRTAGDAWNRILHAAGEFLDQDTIALWLDPLHAVELADGTLTITGPATHTRFAATRLLGVLDEIRGRLGDVQRLCIVALEDGDAATTYTPPPGDPGADGKASRARRHLKRHEAERRRLLAERDQAVADTAHVARRTTASPHNGTWDQLLDVAATRAEFHSPTAIDLWLRPLLPHFADNGLLTLSGDPATLENVRRHFGDQLDHLARITGTARAIRWNPCPQGGWSST